MSNETATAADPAWLQLARGLVGLKEIVGSRHEAKVLEFFAEAGHPEVHNDETAWCAAFCNSMLRRAGYAGTGALNARSFLNWGTKLDTPKPGCIAVFKRGNSGWEGHVAFFLRDLGDYIEVLGGNQGNAVSITRMPKASLLGYRWPLIKAVKPAVVVTPAKIVKAPASKAATASAAVGGAVAAGSAAAASQNGVSVFEIIAWIGGLSAVAVGAFIIIYRIIKGVMPWTSPSTGAALPEPLPLLPQSSDQSLALASARLALSSAASPATPLPKPSKQSQPRKRSAKPSSKTRTPLKKSSNLKTRAAKKSALKSKSKQSG